MDPSLIRRRDDVQPFNLTPTDTMRFVFEGGPDTPDVMDETLAPGDGPPLHSHPWMTWEVVVEGRLRVVMGDDEFEVGPGDGVFTPPDVPHSFMATGDSPARVIGINWPGGFHRLYTAFGALVAEHGELDPSRMAAAAAEHGATIMGPPLAVLHAGR